MGNKSTEEPDEDRIFGITSLSSIIVASDQKSSSVDKLINSTESLVTDFRINRNTFKENIFLNGGEINSKNADFNQRACSNAIDSQHLSRKSFESCTQSDDNFGQRKDKFEIVEIRSENPCPLKEYDEDTVEAVLEFLDNIIDGEDFDEDSLCVENDGPFEQNITKKIESSMQLFSDLSSVKTSEIVKLEINPQDNKDNDLKNKITNNLFVENLWMAYDYESELDLEDAVSNFHEKKESIYNKERNKSYCEVNININEDCNGEWSVNTEPPLKKFSDDVDSFQDVTAAILHLRHQLSEILPHSGESLEYFNQDKYDVEDQTEELAETNCSNERSDEIVLSYKRPLSPIVEESEVEELQSSIHTSNKIGNNDSTTTIESSVDPLDAFMGQVPKTLYASNDTLFAFEDSFNDTDIVSPKNLPTPQKSHDDKFCENIAQSEKGLSREISENTTEILPFKNYYNFCDYDKEGSESNNTQQTENNIGADLLTDNGTKSCISIDKDEERLSEISEPTFDSEIFDKANMTVNEHCQFSKGSKTFRTLHRF